MSGQQKNRVLIFDTTLRDGEQSPGAILFPEEKIKIALALENLGVDIIEAGFPISSAGDYKSVKSIAYKINKSIICGLSRAVEKDIKVAAEAIKPAKLKRIHTFIGISDIQIKSQFKKTRKEILQLSAQSIQYAKKFVSDVQLGLMDATRANEEFLYKVIRTAISAVAKTVDIADTVGYILPMEMEKLIKRVKANVKGINKITIAVHCHNDLGLASANSLSAIKAGARQVDCTINGIGERAGNTSLEEIVMILKVRKHNLHLETGIDTKKIYSISRLVSKLTRILVQPNKAIVGRNAFVHASGIHQDGYLKKRETFEIMKPQDIGLKSSKIVLGARSGRHALKYRLGLLGINPSENQLSSIYEKFLKLADKKRIVTNKDLLNIIKK